MSGQGQAAIAAAGNSGAPESPSWLAAYSKKPVLSIGKVVERIKPEFPALTVSKVRYLEEQGIVCPSRSASGYRKYCEADVERIKFCLRSQRDSYLPIRAICEQLQALDHGEKLQPPMPVRLVADQGELVNDALTNEGKISTRELLDLTGVSREELDELVKAGLIKPDLSGRVPGRSHQVVRLVTALRSLGIDPAQLRFLVTCAQRSTDLLDRFIGRTINTRTAAGKQHKHAQVQETSEQLAVLFTQLIRISADDLP